jgi:hypothetical protein
MWTQVGDAPHDSNSIEFEFLTKEFQFDAVLRHASSLWTSPPLTCFAGGRSELNGAKRLSKARTSAKRAAQ